MKTFKENMKFTLNMLSRHSFLLVGCASNNRGILQSLRILKKDVDNNIKLIKKEVKNERKSM
jgi:hypothetical protein